MYLLRANKFYAWRIRVCGFRNKVLYKLSLGSHYWNLSLELRLRHFKILWFWGYFLIKIPTSAWIIRLHIWKNAGAGTSKIATATTILNFGHGGRFFLCFLRVSVCFWFSKFCFSHSVQLCFQTIDFAAWRQIKRNKKLAKMMKNQNCVDFSVYCVL